MELSCEESGQVAQDFSNNDLLIFDQNFHRIILDEAHMIRNASTLYFKGTKALTATHKLCLTGTPFVNHPRDIHSFLAFLDVAPYNNIETFNLNVVEPIEERKEVGLARLRVLMGAIAIRRTKKEVDEAIKLPEKSVQIRKIIFPEACEHKEISEMVYRICRAAFIALTKSEGGKIRGNAIRLFGMVLRVRQSCCDANLIPIEVREEVTSVWEQFHDFDLDDLDEEDGMNLSDKLLDALTVAKNRIEASKAKNAREEDVMDIVGKPSIAHRKQIKSCFGRSPKVQALMDAIGEMKRSEKGVIFSQWTQFLDM